MRNFYYIVSSLPALKWGEPPPFSAKIFCEMCSNWISKRQAVSLFAFDIAPSSIADGRGSSVAGGWKDWDSSFRNSLLRLRAKEKGRNAEKHIVQEKRFYSESESLAQNAFAAANPLEKERFIAIARWKKLDELQLGLIFDFEFLVAYKLKLLLLERWALLNKESGRGQFAEIQRRILYSL